MRLNLTNRCYRREAGPAALSNEEIHAMIEWIAAEVRAEDRFGWYRSFGPSRHIRRCPPGAN